MTKILLISLQGIGNTLLLLPLVRAYLLKYSGCQVDLVIPDNGTLPFFKSLPEMGTIFCWQENKTVLQNILYLRISLADIYYNRIYAIYPNWKRENITALLAQGDSRSGYTSDKRFIIDTMLNLFNGFKDSRIENKHDLVNNCILLKMNQQQVLAPAVYGSLKDSIWKIKATAIDMLSNNLFKICLHPGSKVGDKCWQPEKYAKLVNSIDIDVAIYIVGSSADSNAVEELYNLLEVPAKYKLLDLPFTELYSFYKQTDLFIGTDSAPMHLAALADIPVLSLFAYTNYNRIAPIGQKSVIIRRDLECSPCYDKVRNVRKSCKKDIECIKKLEVEEVSPLVSKMVNAINENEVFHNSCLSDSVFESDCRLEYLPVGSLVISLHKNK